jgi:hypothetical protein
VHYFSYCYAFYPKSASHYVSNTYFSIQIAYANINEALYPSVGNLVNLVRRYREGPTSKMTYSASRFAFNGMVFDFLVCCDFRSVFGNV